MLIKELHKDIERYLQHDFYCPNEIYTVGGFFYQSFYEDQECEKLGEKQIDNDSIIGCVAYPYNDKQYKP